MFSATQLQRIQGAEKLYDLIEKNVQNAKNIIDEKLNTGKTELPFKNMLNKALISIELLQEELEKTGNTELFSDYEAKILNQIMPTIQEAMDTAPDRIIECENITKQLNQLKEKISESQSEVGRKLIAKYMEKNHFDEVRETMEQLEKFCTPDMCDKIKNETETLIN